MIANGKNGNGHARDAEPSARDIEIYHRRRVQCESTKALAEEYKLNPSRIRQIVLETEAWFLKRVSNDVDRIKRLHTDRLELLLDRVMPNALTGDLKAVDQACSVMSDIRKIWGAEAPAKVESTNHNFSHNFQTREQLAEQLVKLRQTLVPKEN